MYYIWKYETDNSTNFFSCGIEQFEGWYTIPWGREIDRELPSPLKYFTDNKKLVPEDYPMTGGSAFLVSNRIADILKGFNIPGVDYYESQIERPNGEIIKNYCTLNILSRVSCLDKEGSNIRVVDYGPAEVLKFNKLSLDYSKIPDDKKLFWLAERLTLLITHELIVKECEKAGITGINFIPVEKYRDI
ncbi:MAG: hypothetical protein GY754_12950 [bacterium]|nr:hypothetical protein [bacterium]